MFDFASFILGLDYLERSIWEYLGQQSDHSALPPIDETDLETLTMNDCFTSGYLFEGQCDG